MDNNTFTQVDLCTLEPLLVLVPAAVLVGVLGKCGNSVWAGHEQLVHFSSSGFGMLLLCMHINHHHNTCTALMLDAWHVLLQYRVVWQKQWRGPSEHCTGSGLCTRVASLVRGSRVGTCGGWHPYGLCFPCLWVTQAKPASDGCRCVVVLQLYMSCKPGCNRITDGAVAARR